MFDLFNIDPRFFEGSDATSHMCQGCYQRPANHVHHKIFKGMGGRKRKAKISSEDASNKIELCIVCHEATHGIPAYVGNFSCKTCTLLDTCYHGRRTLKLPCEHLSPPW